jgi:hypothetical protein
MRFIALVVVLAAGCGTGKGSQPPAASRFEAPTVQPLPSPSPRPSVPAAAPATPTCEDAADLTIRIAARMFPELEAPGREGVIDQCRMHPWDDEERRCMAAAEREPNATDKDVFWAIGRCHSEGDCRRHPDWKPCQKDR